MNTTMIRVPQAFCAGGGDQALRCGTGWGGQSGGTRHDRRPISVAGLAFMTAAGAEAAASARVRFAVIQRTR